MPLRFPSFDYLLSQARQSFMRFPLTVLSSLVAAVVAIFLIETEPRHFERLPYNNLMLCAALGIPLYFCVNVLATRQQFSPRHKLIAQGVATALLLAIYFTLPNASSTHNTSLPYIRYAVYSISIHLLVSFIPFLFSRQLRGFWNYNKSLFLRFLSALLYSGFLYTGLALALFALHTLFDLKIHEALYGDLLILIFGFFNTWFFVAGVPLDFEQLEQDTDYPRGLKVFCQYVLIPLLILYLLILYGYGIKIIISWNWPKGIVAYLIMCVSVLGILAMLLIYPYAQHSESSWFRKLYKGYYLLLLPLLVLLFLAIGIRLADYGFTINRYIILAIGVWLSVICIYFLSGRTNIKFVPMSLAAFLLVISVGPWSMFAVSERDQVRRLNAILSESFLLDVQDAYSVKGEVIWLKDSLPTLYSSAEDRNDGILNDSLHNEVKSIMDYLDDHHGFTAIRPWYSQNLDSIIVAAETDTTKYRRYTPTEANLYMRTLGLPYEHKSTDSWGGRYVNYSSNTDVALNVQGFDKLIFFDELYYYNEYPPKKSTGRAFSKSIDADGTHYSISYDDNRKGGLIIETERDTLEFPLKQLIKQLRETHKLQGGSNIPDSSMSMELSHQHKKYKLVLEVLTLNVRGDSVAVQSLSSKLLIAEPK